LLCVVLLAAYRPWPPAEFRHLDAWIAVALLAIAVQFVPLPGPVVDVLSPSARGAWQVLSLGAVTGPLPLSVDLSSTAWALGVFAGAMGVFAVSRQVFASGGVRVVARGIATIGLLLSAVSLAQDATAHGLMYWRWSPPFQVAPPFGPFLNRNHFATWVVMAVPASLGYLLVHGFAHTHHRDAPIHWHRALIEVMDARSIWLAASICLMLVGLVASLSRAGMVGLIAGLVAGTYLGSRQRKAPVSGWAIAALAFAALAAVIRINPVDLFHRFGAVGVAAAGRAAIWRATLPVVRDFWLTGTGAGTFETIMLAYQQTPSLFRINAAHNHYLQVVAEGGLLVAVPVAVALVLFVRAAMAALARDHSGMYLLRAGSFAGLIGVAVQSIWETGLTTPANAVLAAVLAGIVVHRPIHGARSAE
jgi:O-antigen ligase